MAGEKAPQAPSQSNPDFEAGTQVTIDPEKEKKLVRKLDKYLIPAYMITYISAVLDRSIIGNAKVAGMADDLHLVGSEFNVAVSIFFVTYILFEVPLTVLLKVIGPSKMLPGIVICWSMVAVFTGFVGSYGSLLACRLLLGLFESALFPSLNLYTSMFWKREEIAKRASMLLVGQATAGAFGGLLAWAIVQIPNTGGYASWRWLFFVEGMLTFTVGVGGFFLLPNSAGTAFFLTQEEKELAQLRLVHNGVEDKFNKAQVKEALQSPMCWLSGFIQFSSDTYNYGIQTFLPTIIHSMGYTSLQAQYLTIPVYVTGMIFYFTAATIADKTQRRAPIMLSFGLLTIAGYAVLLGSRTTGVLYFACFLVMAGALVPVGLNITWINTNTAGHYKRATAIGINQTIGNLGGVIAGQIYLSNESPFYVTGQTVSLAGICLAWFGTLAMMFLLRKKNSEKQKKIEQGVQDETPGDQNIHFKYLI